MSRNFVEDLKDFDVDAFLIKNKNLTDDELLFKYHKSSIPVKAIIEQVKARRTLKRKIPSLLTKGLLYTKKAAEQCSSELSSIYKSNIIQGDTFIDLTGGLGIDFYFLQENFSESHYCEKNSNLFEIVKHNFSKLGLHSTLHNKSGIEFIESFTDNYFDWIYLDPDRKPDSKKRISLKAFEPDITGIIDLLAKKANKIAVKLSPMLDYSYLQKHINFLSEFHVISIDGECKEIFVIIEPGLEQNTVIKAVVINSKTGHENLISSADGEIYEKVVSSKLLKFFYEPDPAIIKVGLSRKLAYKNDIVFVNQGSDYMTSDKPLPEFPGRKFRIVDVIPYNKKTLKNYLKICKIYKANVAKRGFPDSVDYIKKILQLKDGGNSYLFFTHDNSNNYICIHAEAF